MLSMIKKYVLQKMPLFAVIMVTSLIFSVVFFTENVPLDTVLYGFLISTVALIVYIALDFRSYAIKIKTLSAVKENVQHKTDSLPRASSEVEMLYTEIAQNWEMLYNQAQLEKVKNIAQTSDFYTKWVHQIKTPIFALSLLVREQKDNHMMLSELSKIEQYTNMVLGYLRLFESDNDLVIKNVNVKGVVSEVLKSFAPIFLAKGLRPVLELDDFYIMTDEKHLKFAFSQIVSNAAKYSTSGDIHITAKDSVLKISDTGIGIDASDLPRIFDKGFTGFSGRIEEKSTGLGLYLCKKTLDLLGFSITVQSNKGQGTDVFIDLSQESRLHE